MCQNEKKMFEIRKVSLFLHVIGAPFFVYECNKIKNKKVRKGFMFPRSI